MVPTSVKYVGDQYRAFCLINEERDDGFAFVMSNAQIWMEIIALGAAMRKKPRGRSVFQISVPFDEAPTRLGGQNSGVITGAFLRALGGPG